MYSLSSGIQPSLFLEQRRTVSSKLFDKQQAHEVHIEEFVISRHACCVLCSLRYNEHSLMLYSYLSRIENASCSGCGSPTQNAPHHTPSCPTTRSLPVCSSRTPFFFIFGRDLAGCRGSMIFRQAPIPRKRSGDNSRSRNRCVTLAKLLFMVVCH